MRRVDEECRALLALCAELERVLNDQEWLALGAVDQAIRGQLLALARQPAPSEAALRAKQRLQQLHGRAYEAASAECERLRQLLLSHLQHADGRAAYRQVSGN